MIKNKEHEELKFFTWLKDNYYCHYDLNKIDIFSGIDTRDSDFLKKYKEMVEDVKFTKEEWVEILNRKTPENIYFRGSEFIINPAEVPVKFYIYNRYPNFKILYNYIFKNIGFNFDEFIDFYRDAIYSLKDKRHLKFTEWFLKDLFQLRVNYPETLPKDFNNAVDELIYYDKLSQSDIESLSYDDSAEKIFISIKNDSVLHIPSYVDYFLKKIKENHYHFEELFKKIVAICEAKKSNPFDEEAMKEIIKERVLRSQSNFNDFHSRINYYNSLIESEEYILYWNKKTEELIGPEYVRFIRNASKENAVNNKDIEETEKFYKKEHVNQIMLYVLRKKLFNVALHYIEKGYELNALELKIIKSNKKALKVLGNYVPKEDEKVSFIEILMQGASKKVINQLNSYHLTKKDYEIINEYRKNNNKLPYNIKGKEDEILYYSPIIQTVIKSAEKTCILIDKIGLDEKEKFLVWNALFSEMDKAEDAYKERILDTIKCYSIEIKKEIARNICMYLEEFLWQPNRRKSFDFIGYKVVDFCYEVLVKDNKADDFDKAYFLRMMTLRNTTNAKYLMYNIYPLAKYLSKEQIAFIFDNTLLDVFNVYEEGLKNLHSSKENDIEMMNEFKISFTFKSLEYLVERDRESDLCEKMATLHKGKNQWHYDPEKINEFMVFFENTLLAYQLNKKIREDESQSEKGEGQTQKRRRL